MLSKNRAITVEHQRQRLKGFLHTLCVSCGYWLILTLVQKKCHQRANRSLDSIDKNRVARWV